MRYLILTLAILALAGYGARSLWHDVQGHLTPTPMTRPVELQPQPRPNRDDSTGRNWMGR